MNILYITPLLPKTVLEEVFKKDQSHYVFAPQKFHRNLVEGFIANGHSVQVLSTLPTSVKYVSNLDEDGVKYCFIPYKNTVGVKHFQVVNSVSRKILFDKTFKPDIIICDTLNASMCIGAFLVKRLTKAKFVGIVTDLPESMSKYEKGLLNRAASYFSTKYIKNFDYYVLLTRQMNDVVNPKGHPYMIMEGVCGINPEKRTIKDVKGGKRKILYAGGRPSKDGVDMLIAAFRQLPDNDLELNVYGDMPDVEKGPDTNDSRIIYHGKTENCIIAEAEQNSYLLVNPRPTGEDYTKYSFPSKVMEYMASGTPMVTTKLAGIPEEYFKYIYAFKECTTECYLDVLRYILSQDVEVHFNKGREAQAFVLNNKSKLVQTKRIIELVK